MNLPSSHSEKNRIRTARCTIITDGENHEDDAIQQATTAVEGGITVHTIGVGSPDGTPIPVYVNGKKSGFRKDNQGNTVITKLNETMLQQVADHR